MKETITFWVKWSC